MIFSSIAINEAQKGAIGAEVNDCVKFLVQDTTKTWPFENESFDFAINCFASTDIETIEGRSFARDEFMRVLKPGGYLLVYMLSTDDEFHKEIREESPRKKRMHFFIQQQENLKSF